MLAQVVKLTLLVTLLSSAGCVYHHHDHDHDRYWGGYRDSHQNHDWDDDDRSDRDHRKGRHR